MLLALEFKLYKFCWSVKTMKEISLDLCKLRNVANQSDI